MRRKGAEDDVVGCLCDRIFFLDRLFGDPVWLYHPVRMIGNMISFLEKRLRKENDKKNMTAGGVLWIIVAILRLGFRLRD